MTGHQPPRPQVCKDSILVVDTSGAEEPRPPQNGHPTIPQAPTSPIADVSTTHSSPMPSRNTFAAQPLASTSSIPYTVSKSESPAAPALNVPTTASAGDMPSVSATKRRKVTPANDGEVASEQKKRKKLPSCDACKLRRVLCLPQPAPASCPRCSEKGIVCTTTPVIRKRPSGRTGKRIEEARATFGAADIHAAPHLQTPSNAPWLQPRIQPRLLPAPIAVPTVSAADIDSRLGMSELSGVLASHLIALYQSLPQSWLPLFPRGRLSLQFEAAGRRLDQLPPGAEVLAHTIIALTCRVSSHPLLFGTSPNDSPIPSFESLTPEYLANRADLREYGRRRAPICQKLQEKAVRFAWERGTLAECSEENMACCSLLEMMEGRNDPTRGKPYGSAYVSHLRSLLDDTNNGTPRVLNISLGWSALIMREALYAANAGRTSHFTAADDLLLCGPAPPSIEEALLETVDDVDIRDSITLFFRPMRPYTYHAARLARECSDRITGTYSRRQPLDERYVAKFLTQLDHLFHLLTILHGRIDFVLSAAATSAHALPAPFETERHYIMKACIYTLQLAWASLSLPIYYDLRRRIKELESGPSSTVGERRRTRERLDILLKQVHRSTLKGARMGASAVHNAPSLSFLAELHQEKLDSWVEILMEAVPEEEGGEGITRAEKTSDLQWMCDGYKAMGWAWCDHEDIIKTLEWQVEQLQLDAPSSFEPSSSSIPLTSTTTPSSNPIFDTSAFAAGLPSEFTAFFSASQSQLSGGGIPSGILPFDLDSLLSIPLFGAMEGGTDGAAGFSMAGMSTDSLFADLMGSPSLVKPEDVQGVGGLNEGEDDWMNV